MTIQCDVCWEQLEKPPTPKAKSPAASLLSWAGKRKADASTSNSGGCIVTPCGHLYHKKCINDWLDAQTARKETKNCPTCRGRLPLKTSKLIEVFPSTTDELEREITDLRREVQGLTSNFTEATLENRNLRVENRKLINELASCKKTKNSGVEEAKRNSPIVPIVISRFPSTRSKQLSQKSNEKTATAKRGATMDVQVKSKKKASELEANQSVTTRSRSRKDGAH